MVNYATYTPSVMTTAGDTIIENATPAAARLPAGSLGQVLQMAGSGLPAWATINGGTSFKATGFGVTNANNAVTANQLYLAVVQIPVACTLTGIAILNGGTAAGNLTVALFNAAGSSQLAVSASASQSGTFRGQQVPFTGTLAVTPGSYILASIFSSSSATAGVEVFAAPSAQTAQGSYAMPSSVTAPSFQAFTIPAMITY